MNKEVLFAKKLEEVRKLASEQGNCVSEKQVQEIFEELALSGDQLQMVYDYLLQHKVGLGQPLDPDDYLTDEEKDYLQDYLEEIESLEEKNPGEKDAVTLSAMAGDVDAQNRLVELYLKEIPQIATLYAGQGVFLEDLIGEGNVALATGVLMFGTVEKKEEVQGMLMKMVMDAMEDYIRENADAKKADQRLADKINEVADKAKELAEEMRRKVTVEELAAESSFSVKTIRDAMRMSGNKIEDIEPEE